MLNYLVANEDRTMGSPYTENYCTEIRLRFCRTNMYNNMEAIHTFYITKNLLEMTVKTLYASSFLVFARIWYNLTLWFMNVVISSEKKKNLTLLETWPASFTWMRFNSKNLEIHRESNADSNASYRRKKTPTYYRKLLGEGPNSCHLVMYVNVTKV